MVEDSSHAREEHWMSPSRAWHGKSKDAPSVWTNGLDGRAGSGETAQREERRGYGA